MKSLPLASLFAAYSTAASAAFLASDLQAAICAFSLWARNVGIAMAARMPMMIIDDEELDEGESSLVPLYLVKLLEPLGEKLKHTLSFS